MSEHGASLQTYNQELVKCLEDLKSQQMELAEVIKKEEAEEALLQKNISSLQEKLNTIQNNLKYHKQIRDDYNQTIQETETGFKKILESSQTLLNLAQHQSKKLKNIR
ncbi:hypothetical protein WA026_006531 [Henosepilachna vigintioctopunctata]|uniref:Uncharacterized protein n=1 Tax=Henosepilachna vigintioctopunctata TaxID=420089 RepID=A0AAW1UA93_9CUCU